MCGFVCFKSLDSFQSLYGDLPGAVSSLAHRGPDDSGLFFDEKSGVGLGHRRLSIIDLTAAGRQPMTSEDGKVSIVYNGEVYNFKEIRSRLEGLGHSFFSSTDTEVVLKAYMEWGKDCLDHFVGMFAFVIWDSGKQTFFAARDRLGIKPFYYYFDGKNLICASELKAIMAFRSFPRNIDFEALQLFFHYQYIPAPKTIFQNTYKLPPGHCGLFDGTDLDVRSYWEIPEGPVGSSNAPDNERDALDELDLLLTRAVSDRLISDVPLGALLSGGIDSSMVVALMQKVNSTPVRTFSIGFDVEGFDEAPWASQVARHLGTEHTELYVETKDALEVVSRLPEIYDEPFADSSAIPTYLVSRLARSNVTVALSGDGGDEQFAGYTRYWGARDMWERLRKAPYVIRRSIGEALRIVPAHFLERAYAGIYRIIPRMLQVANFPDKWEKLTKAMVQDSLTDIYRAMICIWNQDEIFELTGKGVRGSIFEDTLLRSEGLPILSRLMRVDQKTYLPDDMLTKVDRASMAVGFEVRVPLLDHRVLEYSAGMPEGLKYRNGAGKYILRRLLGRYIPRTLYERPKMGFGIPLGSWLRTDLRQLLLDHLSPMRLREEGLFNHSKIENVIKEHMIGKTNHQHRLWSLLMWEMWRDRWLIG
ncbi:MAG: asparagine synthase (glutamine-hydrolyzing) [Desulfatiglans sp.]|nr:asparagine synthase (glutamine-hydrolyzing) [Desulfatiglans sp.]